MIGSPLPGTWIAPLTIPSDAILKPFSCATAAPSSRFDNVFTGPGEIESGAIARLPRTQTLEELEQNLLICTRDEFIDQLAVYEEAGVDELILSQNIDTPNQETLENMQSIAEEVMPRFSKLGKIEAAE